MNCPNSKNCYTLKSRLKLINLLYIILIYKFYGWWTFDLLILFFFAVVIMTCVAMNTGTYTLIVLSTYCGSRTDDKAKCEAALVGVAKQWPRAALVITSLSSMHAVSVALYPSQQLVFSVFSYLTILFFFHSYLTWY